MNSHDPLFVFYCSRLGVLGDTYGLFCPTAVSMKMGKRNESNPKRRWATNYEWREGVERGGGLCGGGAHTPAMCPLIPLLNRLFFNSPSSPPTTFCSKSFKMLCALFHVCSCDVSVLWTLCVLTSDHLTPGMVDAFDGDSVYGLLRSVHCLFKSHNKSYAWFGACVLSLGGHVCAEIAWRLEDDGRENETLTQMRH